MMKCIRLAFLGTQLFNAPLWALYSMLLFILYKDLHASPFQITLFLTLKPVVSLLSIYWGHLTHHRLACLRNSVITAGIIGRFLFFFVPWVASPWYLITASALYMLMMRGVIPAWMEILKRTLPQAMQGKIFSHGSVISYLGATLLPLCLGGWLDAKAELWRWLFPAAALLSSASLFFQFRLPSLPSSLPNREPRWRTALQPLTTAWHLLKTRRDFLHFQLGFFFGGGALMLMQPALPPFFVDTLQLSYTEMAIAIALCKGVGFTLASPLWTRWLKRIPIYKFSSWVSLLATLFPLTLLLAKAAPFWLYLAYFGYGIMQAGSELSWHLSGPLFAREEESSDYSRVNVLAVGIRGLIAPAIGSLLCSWWGGVPALVLGGALCLIATLYMTYCHRTALVKLLPHQGNLHVSL